MNKYLAGAIAAGLLMAASPASAQDKITVWWVKGFYKSEDDALFEAIKKYEAKTGVKVDLSQYAVQDMIPKTVAAMDSGTVFQRRNNRQGIDKGGWNVFPAALNGLGQTNPAESYLTRGNGAHAWYGWPTSPRVEQLHAAYLSATDAATQHRIADQLQTVLMQEAPFLPLGQIVSPTAYRRTLSGVSHGFPTFWGVSKA